jgi:hypothetical protein
MDINWSLSPTRTTGSFSLATHPLTASGRGRLRGEKTTEVGLARLTVERRPREEEGNCSGEWDRFVDQHDRNAITHGVFQTTFVAEERGVLLAILQFTTTLGANENLEELLRHCHFCRSS